MVVKYSLIKKYKIRRHHRILKSALGERCIKTRLFIKPQPR